MLRTETRALWQYLLGMAPDDACFAPFFYENDYHNLKTTLKGVVRGRNYRHLLIEPALVDPALLERAVKEGRFDLLPPYLRGGEAARTALVENGDPQLADGILDAACLDAQREAAAATKNAVIQRIADTKVFFNTIKAAIRAAKAQKSAAFLDAILVDTDRLSKHDLIAAARAGEDAVLELLEKKGFAQAAERYRESPAAFEKYADDQVTAAARDCRFANSGIEPLLGYLMARLAELKTVRILYSGVKTGQPEQTVRERLRDLLYG